MKRILLIFASLLLAVGTLCAEKISEQQARNIAGSFVAANTRMKKAPGVDATLRMVKQSDSYYAFARGSRLGYVIVAADDRITNNILGYATEGTFDPDNLPDAMLWWLGEYDRQLAYASASSPSPHRVTKALTTHDPVDPPLLGSTIWGQDAPYNDNCPVHKNETTPCPTGCVATALAQIMYYHKWPAQGVGSHSYTYEYSYTYYFGTRTATNTLTANFGHSRFLVGIAI